MRVKNCINSIAKHEGISISSIARAVGQSPQNLGQKLNRDSIRMNDLLQIAEALDIFGNRTALLFRHAVDLFGTRKPCTFQHHRNH